jgi:hypothetical protein
MTILQIEKAFGHKLIGSKFMKQKVCRALLFLPERIIKIITSRTWFVSSFPDGWAFTLRGDELKKGEHLIFLTDDLLRQDERQIIWTILHEIGHVVLGHRNSIGKVQTKSEVKKQEKAADEFVEKYLEV